MAFVVDNSVVVGWHFPNQATTVTDRAFQKLAQHTAFVPSLWRLEFANVLVKMRRQQRISAEQMQAIVTRQSQLDVVVNETAVAMQTLLDLALPHQLSSYDASYLELALRLQLPLATKDEALRAAARSSGVLLI